VTRELHRDSNLLDLYEYSIGKRQSPMILHRWCAIAGIAACLEDRVWVPKMGKPLNPSLWIMLIAPSAIGKGDAIGELMDYMRSAKVNTFYGEVTAQSLMKAMSGDPKKGLGHRAKIFLVNEEAAMCIRYGLAAKDFLIHMTGMYKVPKGMPLRKEALSSGRYAIHDPCINWTLGSTMEWAVDSIPREAIEGGFLGRLLPVIADYNLDERIPRPERPHNLRRIQRWLHERFRELRELCGEFEISDQALEIHAEWYMKRKSPVDERLIPTWIRRDDNVWKMAQNLAVADRPKLRILAQHMRQAILITEALEPASRLLLRAASSTDRTKDMTTIEKMLKKAKVIKHSVLMQKCSAYGIDKRGMVAAIDMLQTMGRVKAVREAGHRGPPALVYQYITRHT
jgi:hypothetical protein